MNFDVFADDEAARFRSAAPGQAEVLAVDLAGDREAGARVTPGILDHTTEFRVEFFVPGDATDRQVPIYFIRAVIIHILIFGGDEFELREIGGIEEVYRFQMAVTLFVLCVDGVDVDGERYFRRGEIFSFRLHGSIELLEITGHGRNHHMLDFEFDFRVRGIQDPFRCCHFELFLMFEQ